MELPSKFYKPTKCPINGYSCEMFDTDNHYYKVPIIYYGKPNVTMVDNVRYEDRMFKLEFWQGDDGSKW